MKGNFNIIGELNSEWIKYSDYEIKMDNTGERYIKPVDGSNFELYNPFDKSKNIIFDLLNIGDYILNENNKQENVDNMILEFVKEYGLLGIISSSVYNRDIIGESKVLLTENNCLKQRERIMDEDKYINLFIPFAKEDEVYIRKLGKHMTLVKSEDSPRFYGKRPMILDLVFSKFYCEKIDWIIEFARMMSTHVNQTLIYKDVELTEAITVMSNKFKCEKIGISIGIFKRPFIQWDFDSLKTTIETIYTFIITGEGNILKRCEHCNKVFIGKSDKEKYCSSSCRNCYNVTKSRRKHKGIE